jgi:glycosyltransferase involved in cell wall biosynthesis
MPPDISVIIPVFNRGILIRYTLESVRRASAGLAVEFIVVDDGSEPPAAESIARLGGRFFHHLARAIGPVPAARLLRLLQVHPHENVRTMDDAQFRQLLAALPES